VRHIVEGYVAGQHRSTRHGFSIEFAEHREYTPGDDLRYLDWKVFGRTDKLYLKQFEDETNLVCYLLLDVSESMRYRGPGSPLSKFEYASCIAGSLAWLVLQQQDSVGLVTFDDRVRTVIRPSSNPSHLRQLMHVVEGAEPIAKTALGPVLHELAERLSKRGLVVLLSDLFDDVPSLLAGLKHFRHRRHEVIVFHTLDAAELDFPFHEPTLFQGLEQRPRVLTDARSLRRAYLDQFQRYRNSLMQGCRSHQLDYQLVRTDASLAVALAGFLAARNARMK
jgi:uncharacterized protein (DUF58 family)